MKSQAEKENGSFKTIFIFHYCIYFIVILESSINIQEDFVKSNVNWFIYSTVTLFAKLRGISGFLSFSSAIS